MASLKQDNTNRNVALTSPHVFENTVDLLKQAINAAEFILIHEINTQQILASKGIKIAGLRQLLFFNPAYMKRLLDINPEAILEVPLKFVIVESADKSVVVRYIRPRQLFDRYTGLTELAKELEEVVADILYVIGGENSQRSML